MNICLYGASSTELDARYLDAAYDLGRRIAAGGHTMVYGGGAQGVMGAAARGVVDGGGALVGIAPTFFKRAPGVLFDGCSEFIDTKTMAERKTLMMQRADAFVMAPGGIGTYEEFFEVLTLKPAPRRAQHAGLLRRDAGHAGAHGGRALCKAHLPANLPPVRRTGGADGLSGTL